MQIHFSYPNVALLDVPEGRLLAQLEPRRLEPSKPVSQLVEEALDNTIGSPRVEELVAPNTRVLLLVDDITRQTPTAALLPSLLRRIEARGCPRKNVKILIAAGTHARMTQQELEKKLGASVLRDYEVHLHHWRALENLREIGKTEDGTPIRINRMLGEADLVMGVGQIVPHRVMGFTGGATIVQPGVSGPEITGHTHWLSAVYPGSKILGVADNPVRLEVEQIARKAGLRFIVNVVLDAEQHVIHVVAGDPVAAHRAGAKHSLAIYGSSQPRLAEIVVSESYPADYDLWQAAKGIYAAELSVAQGGVVILVTPCPHGVAEEHPEVEEVGYLGFEEIKQMVEQGKLADRVAAAHLVHVGRVIRDMARGIMVCPGIPPDIQRRLGFESANTPQEALDKAFAMAGKTASVAVLHQGGNVLPLVAESGSTAGRSA